MYIFEERVHIQDRMIRHHKSMKNLHNSHWNENAIILLKFSSLAAVKVVKMTIFNDENFIKMTTFPISVSYHIMHPHHSIAVLYNAIIDIYDSMIFAAP